MDPIQSNRPPSSGGETPTAADMTTGSAGVGAPAAHQQRSEEAGQGTAGFSAGPNPTSSGGGGGGHTGSGQAGASGRSAGAGAGQGSGGDKDPIADRARELAEQLKPVAVAAEEVAVKAVDLSAKGLTRLSAYLEKRRQERQSTPSSTQRPDDV